MARPRISPTVLADKGVPLTLAGGLEVTLCFSFKALMLLEERYGSLQEAAALMSGKAPADAPTATVADSSGVIQSGPITPTTGAPVESTGGAPFSTVAGILACGLAHEVEPDDGAPLDNVSVLADYLETDKITTYSDAISAAFSKAFPSDPTEAGSTDTPPATTTEDSRGESGTGSLESGSTSETTSSGA